MSLFGSIHLAGNALRAQDIGLQVVGQNIANQFAPAARAVDILDPQQELPAPLARQVMRDDRGIGMPQVQQAVGTGGKAGAVGHGLGSILRFGLGASGELVHAEAQRRKGRRREVVLAAKPLSNCAVPENAAFLR